jgi:hypothetical protein
MTSVSPLATATTSSRNTGELVPPGPGINRVQKLGPFNPAFKIGGELTPPYPTTFFGRVAMIRVLNYRYGAETSMVNAFKIEHKYGNENEDLLTYFDFDTAEKGGSPDQFVFNDNSRNFKAFLGGAAGKIFPNLDELPDLPNLVCLRHDARFCKSFYSSSIPTVIPDSKYLGMSTSTHDYFRISSLKESAILDKEP